MTRYARRTDNNQAAIVDAFRSYGALVEVIHEPVDLRVWADATKEKSMFVEVKTYPQPTGARD